MSNKQRSPELKYGFIDSGINYRFEVAFHCPYCGSTKISQNRRKEYSCKNPTCPVVVFRWHKVIGGYKAHQVKFITKANSLNSHLT